MRFTRFTALCALACCACSNLPSAPVKQSVDSTHPCANLISFRSAHPDPDGLDPQTGVTRYLAKCGLQQSIDLMSQLVALPTAHNDPRAPAAWDATEQLLRKFATDAGLQFEAAPHRDAFALSLGSDPLWPRTDDIDFIVHLDVVPSGAGWQHPPFEVTRVEDRLYGRGTEDDKGPAAAALVMLRALAEAGYAPHRRLVVVLGTAEETDWSGMVRFAKHAKPAHYNISLDGSYPVTVAEHGFAAWTLAADVQATADTNRPLIADAQVGAFSSQIPGYGFITLQSASDADFAPLLQRAQRAVEAEQAQRQDVDPDTELVLTTEHARREVRIESFGRAVHASTAEAGLNAMYPLAHIARTLQVADNSAGLLFKAVERFLDDDIYGERLGIAAEDPLMGRLTVAPTQLHCTGSACELGMDVRWPRGRSLEQMRACLSVAMGRIQSDISPAIHLAHAVDLGAPWVASADAVLPNTLRKIYSDSVQAPAVPASIRGGTYARLYPNAVSFGPLDPGRERSAHRPNEYINIDTLERTVSMLAQAVFALEKTL